MKIGHFTPSYTPISPGQTAQILREESILHGRLGYEYRWWSEELSDIVVIRNRALAQAIEWDLDYLCMQDSDIHSKSSMGAIVLMLETARTTGAAMVAAICGLRRKPHTANVEPCHAGTVYEAKKAGTGLVLIDCRQIAEAQNDNSQWFGKTYGPNGTTIDVGEDIWFCQRLRDAGLSIYVDGRVPTTHAMKDLKTLDYPGAATASSKSPDSYPAGIGTQ